MNTGELIARLTAELRPLRGGAVPRRFGLALGASSLLSLLAMLAVLGLRPDIGPASRLAMFWIKLGFPLCIAGGAVLAAMRLSRPGMPLGILPVAPASLLPVLWGYGAAVLLRAEPQARAHLVLGDSWGACLTAISLLSVPVFAALVWAMKGLAPTRPGLAGAAGGLAAGACGAAIYSLHCTEMQAPFLGTWYVLGMLGPAALGGWLGPRLLRW